ncbi:MAG: dUTP diphosphatase [Planctomycetes bacterium]|nr:dUTP diphosphatase [Planctomycetota bacterium]
MSGVSAAGNATLGRVADVLLQLKRLHAAATLPAYQSEQAAGMDLSACLEKDIVIGAGEIARVPCGFSMALPPGWEGQVRPRSGLATKHGIGIPNAPGTIDSDYRGEVQVPLINFGKTSFTVTHGMRIAQMVVAPVAFAQCREVAELSETARGAGGFGSTGH